jgi:IclR family transcriptional regulator, acetate operon repressor
MGKALLAHRGKSALHTIGPLDRYTEHTICTIEGLEAELEQVLNAGFAADNEEAILGCRFLAAPILLDGLEPEAAVSLTGPAAMVDDATLEELAKQLTDRGANISMQMNSRPAVPRVLLRIARFATDYRRHPTFAFLEPSSE